MKAPEPHIPEDLTPEQAEGYKIGWLDGARVAYRLPPSQVFKRIASTVVIASVISASVGFCGGMALTAVFGGIWP